MPIVRVLDTESTGLALPALVVEWGYCDYDTNTREISDPVSSLCYAEEIDPISRAVHHISKYDVVDKQPFNQDDLFSDEVAVYAAHNVKHDGQWITPPKPWLCTYKAALRAWPDAPAHGNDVLRYWLQDAGRLRGFNEANARSHRAGPDAYVTAWILKALFEDGHTGAEMVKWTREPPMLPRCPIGEYKGKAWADVDIGFLRWMVGKQDMDVDLKWNAQRELDKRA